MPGKLATGGLALIIAAAVAVALAGRLPPRRIPDREGALRPSPQEAPQVSSPSASEESGTPAVGVAGAPSQPRPPRRPTRRSVRVPQVSPRLSPAQTQPAGPMVVPEPAPAVAPAPAPPEEQQVPAPADTGVSADPGPPPARAVEPVLSPPVPLALTPPRHPVPYQMVVDAPGIAAAARLKGVEARVRLRLLVRSDGAVGRAEVAVPSSRPELDAAALGAAMSWRFLPARRDGEPIDSVVLIWVAFVSSP
jgi:protein TonB